MTTTADIGPHAFDVPTFCERNGISITTFYNLTRAGQLRAVKLYGKRLVLAEDEAEFRRRLAAGELERKPTRPEWRNRPRKSKRAAAGATAGEAA